MSKYAVVVTEEDQRNGVEHVASWEGVPMLTIARSMAASNFAYQRALALAVTDVERLREAMDTVLDLSFPRHKIINQVAANAIAAVDGAQ